LRFCSGSVLSLVVVWLFWWHYVGGFSFSLCSVIDLGFRGFFIELYLGGEVLLVMALFLCTLFPPTRVLYSLC